MSLSKVLIANRGEIAVRVIRACRDAELASVAVYADSDRDAPFAQLADEAFALGGNTARETYLAGEKIINIALRAGVDAIHPGYGLLSENADFAEAVLAAGLTWIGPPPQAIRALGDKVTARRIALQVNAPLVPGTQDPVSGPDEVVDFARAHGLPVAIKAAFGGGGRGLKVAYSEEEIPELFDSAVREATAAFGRGECFVERYLTKPRHVEAQVLADEYGNVIVVGTRDCSLQRRHQKLVEEAPAPFLSEQQRSTIHESAKAICAAAGYVSAGTVEFLVGNDGTISFLEVNTRLQVEHPVSEETSGIDLVREQFRIANKEKLRFTHDLEPRGHSFEFRINGEDPGRGFLPAPGTITTFSLPSGPGIRVDTGVKTGSVIGDQFDSLLAKLIVTGENRNQALERARRALAEFTIDGVATVLPFHRKIVQEADFIDDNFAVHTTWIETDFINTIEPYDNSAEPATGQQRRTMVVEVDGRRVEVSLPAELETSSPTPPHRHRRQRAGSATVVSADAVTAPMRGTIVKVAVSEGQQVAAGDLLVVLEAMKMENPVTAGKAGTVTNLIAQVGSAVNQGAMLCELKD